jgi:hypothetical protein
MSVLRNPIRGAGYILASEDMAWRCDLSRNFCPGLENGTIVHPSRMLAPRRNSFSFRLSEALPMAEWSERLLCDGKAIARNQCPGRGTVTRFALMPVQNRLLGDYFRWACGKSRYSHQKLMSIGQAITQTFGIAESGTRSEQLHRVIRRAIKAPLILSPKRRSSCVQVQSTSRILLGGGPGNAVDIAPGAVPVSRGVDLSEKQRTALTGSQICSH